MKLQNIALVVGTRPQIIKSYPLAKSLRRRGFNLDLISTGQHYDYSMADVFFRDYDIAPARSLKIKPGTPNAQISQIIPKLESVFQKSRPDLVIAPGDTTSALAAAIATVKCGIKLAHLEAGGRSIHRTMPEELNRRLVDHSSDMLFAPTKSWAANLKNEKIPGDVFFVGDTMYDLFLEERKKYGLGSVKNSENRVLVTLHRAEKISTRGSLERACSFINSLCRARLDVVFPIHPHTKKRLAEFGLGVDAELIDPVDHIQMMKLVSQSALVVTDSGGLQKEAYWMSRPCIAIHETFEWQELVSHNANFPMWLDRPISAARIRKIIKTRFTPKKSIFGAGNAAEKISDILLRY